MNCSNFAVLVFFIKFYTSVLYADCAYRYNASVESDECLYRLIVSHDSPVILDIPITFYVKLTCATPDEYYTYIFVDNANPSHKYKIAGNSSANLSVVYNGNMYKAGTYVMTVTAYMNEWNPVLLKVAVENVTFLLCEDIPGNLIISGALRRDSEENTQYLATGKVSNMTLDLNFPRSIHLLTEMSYWWRIEKEQYYTVVPYHKYNFSKAGIYKIRVTVVARVPLFDDNAEPTKNMKYKWGYFQSTIIAKDPLRAINLTGNTYLKHGQLFNLDVSCNGSGPFEYCWKIFQPTENWMNLTCIDPVVSTQCFFPIIYYFHESGNYQVVIYVDNHVSALQRNLEVHIYDVSLKPQLSTVTLPVFCTVLVILIIAAGVIFHRRNQQFDVETADFDFLQSDVFVVETFWEHLYHSIGRALCFNNELRRKHLYLLSGDISHIPKTYDSINH